MQKLATQILALLALTLIIWFVIPLISFNHRPLLPTSSDKLILISILFLGWVGYLITKALRLDFKANEAQLNDDKILAFTRVLLNKIQSRLPSKKKNIDASLVLDEGPHIEVNSLLRKHFELVKKYCRESIEKKKHPIYLFIGNHATGKSSLLKKSNLVFKTIPLTQTSEKSSGSYSDFEPMENEHCIWHIHDNCIFIDTPGEFASSEISENILTPWRSLINLLLRSYQKFPLKALIITINIYDLLAESQQTNRLQLYLLKQRILDVKKYYGEQIPLHIIFTKWDAIPGFTEFFDILSIDERQQIFSIKFDKNLAEESVISQFKTQYELLLQQMGRLMITRMHQEHNHKKRMLISQFPLQMEHLQLNLINVISQLMEKTYIIDAASPTAIYFTSCEQNNESVDILFQKLKSSFQLPEKQLALKKQSIYKNYFIYPIFQELVHCEEPAKAELTVSKKNQYAIYAAITAGIFGFAVFNFIKFTHSLEIINNAAAESYAIAANNANSGQKIKSIIVLAHKVNSASDFWLGKKIALNKITPVSKDTLEVLPATAEKNKIAPISGHANVSQLQNYLEKILTNNATSPEVLYSSLRAYLMLSRSSQLNFPWLNHWFSKNIVANNIAPAAQLQQIINSLQHHRSAIQAQETIITQARNQLTSLPKQYLAFLIMQSDADYSEATPLMITVGNKTITVPFLFTAKGLQTIFLNNLNPVLAAVFNGNDVLGKFSSPNNSTQIIQQQLISIYSTSYMSWWSKVFYAITIPHFTNLSNLSGFVTLLNNPNEGIIAIYRTILQNTNSNVIFPVTSNDPVIIAIRSGLSQQLNSGISNLMLLNLSDVQNALSQLNQFLTNLAASDNIPESAFLIIKKQYQNASQPNILTGFGTFATTLPDPLNTLFSNLAQQSQQLTEQAAVSYLQTMWQSQVLQFYNLYLAQRYPLYANAPQDIRLSDFSKFFAPNGILQNFYNNYLAVFINSNSSVWQWQSIDGLSIPLNDDLLLALEKGRIITTMFFPEDSPQLLVNFSLQQIETMPVVQSVSLTINGQSLHDPAGTRNVSTFIWPGNSTNLGTQLSLLNVNGQRSQTSRQGAWSWFRILDITSLHPDGNTQQYSITFDVDGNEAKYRLIASTPINPFIPAIINTFRLPNSVTN